LYQSRCKQRDRFFSFSIINNRKLLSTFYYFLSQYVNEL